MSALPAGVRLRPVWFRPRAPHSDAAAFAAVYERNHQALYRYCRSILHDDQDAQDALQSTMTKAFAALQDEDRDFELRPWLFRIAHNESVTLLRQRRGTAELDDATPASGELEDRVSEREELRLLRMDLDALPERQRAALILRELNGLSHAEIGAVLEVPISGVKQALFDARTALSDSRDGRALACDVVRRTLSDGDGRVLRRRTVRAHLRTCTPCRQFRAELSARPQALRLLAPPLPVAGAAGVASSLFGGSAVKLLACLTLAGGGSTVAAVEIQRAREPVPEAAASRVPVTPPPHRSAVIAAESASATVVPTAVVGAAPPQRAGRRLSAAGHSRPRTRHAITTPTPVAPTRRGTAGPSEAQQPGEPKTEAPRPAASPPADAAAPGRKSDDPPAKARAERPGNRGTAPTHTGAAPGNSGNAPGHSGAAPGNSGNAPGHGGAAPGNSGNAPGHTGAAPGNSGNAPGHAGGAPGNSENAPGHTGGAPGNSENAPGKADGAPGHSGNAPGKGGNSENAPGQTGAAPDEGTAGNGIGGQNSAAPGQAKKPDKPS